MKKKGLIVAFLALSIAASAQDERALSFDQALQLTLEQNPTMAASAYEERAAELEKAAAVGLRMPKINVAGGYAHLGNDMQIDLNGYKGPIQNGVNGVLDGLGQILPGSVLGPIVSQVQGVMTPLLGANWALTLQKQDLAFVGGTVTLPIFLGGKINAANRAARINLATARKQGEQNRNGLVSELVERYYGLALAMQVLEVRRQVADAMKIHLKDAEALEANGMIAKGEKLYVEVMMAEAERELFAAEQQVATLRSALANTMNETGEFVPVSSMFVLHALEELSWFQTTAEQSNPLLQQVALKRDLAKQGVNLQRSEFFPQVAATGGGMFCNYQVTDLVPRWAVGVGVSINIFDGTNREHKFAAAKSTVRQVEALQTKAISDVGVLVEKLYNQLATYQNQIASIETSMAFAKEYLRIKNASFKEGMASAVDVIDAELNLSKIKIERLQNAFNYDVTLSQLLEAAGISEQFAVYARSGNADHIRFDQE